LPEALAEALQALAAWPVAGYLRGSTAAYAAVNAAHIFSLALVVGAIAALDLRMLGLFRTFPLGALAVPLSRVAATGVALSIATGILLFAVRPVAYAVNPAFLIKLALVAVGVANALALRFNRHWAAAVDGASIHASIRAAAMFSLLVWAGAILAGRWIGFLQ
jgi:hypothetical protein